MEAEHQRASPTDDEPQNDNVARGEPFSLPPEDIEITPTIKSSPSEEPEVEIETDTCPTDYEPENDDVEQGSACGPPPEYTEIAPSIKSSPGEETTAEMKTDPELEEGYPPPVIYPNAEVEPKQEDSKGSLIKSEGSEFTSSAQPSARLPNFPLEPMDRSYNFGLAVHLPKWHRARARLCVPIIVKYREPDLWRFQRYHFYEAIISVIAVNGRSVPTEIANLGINDHSYLARRALNLGRAHGYFWLAFHAPGCPWQFMFSNVSRPTVYRLQVSLFRKGEGETFGNLAFCRFDVGVEPNTPDARLRSELSQAEMIRKFQQISMTGSLSSPLPDNSRTVKDLNHHFGTDMALDALESKQITSPEYQNHRVRR